MSEAAVSTQLSGSPPGFLADVEQHLLGVLLSGGDHRRVFDLLKPHNFVEPIHREIYGMILSARERYSSTRMPVVARLITPALDTSFQAAAGTTIAAYMAKCVSNTVYGTGTALIGARNVLEQWARVSVGQQAALLAEAARDPEASALELAREIARQVDDITGNLRGAGRGRSLSTFNDASARALAAAQEARQKGGLVGVPTGLHDYDRLTGGLHRNDLIVLAARPSMGKTIVGSAFCRNAAAEGFGTAFISLEMDAAKLCSRMISDAALSMDIRVPYEAIINGTADEDQLAQLDAVRAAREALPMWIEDQSGLTVTEIRAKVDRIAEQAEQSGAPLQLVVVDHLHLVRASSRYSGNRVQVRGNTSQDTF